MKNLWIATGVILGLVSMALFHLWSTLRDVRVVPPIHSTRSASGSSTGAGTTQHVVNNVSSNSATSIAYNASDMYTFVQDGFRSQFCPRIVANLQHVSHPERGLVDISFGCRDVFENNGYGTGNFLTSIYTLRSIAEALGIVDIVIQCDDANEEKAKLILPWLTGWFPSKKHSTWFYDSLNMTELQKCNLVKKQVQSALAERVSDIQYDLRRLAVALVGIPSIDHPSYRYAQSHFWPEIVEAKSSIHSIATPQQGDSPLFPGLELDDVVLHFRCGDLIYSDEPRYGFMTFDAYARQISPQAQSIGIVTESFDAKGQHRQADNGRVTRDRCRLVVDAFVEHLQQRFPNAQVRIRNGPEETVALAYARLIMANQTVTSLSTFAFFPAVAAFGKALVKRPSPKNLGGWLVKLKSAGKAENIEFFDEPDWLSTKQCKRMWGDDGSAVLQWFRGKKHRS
jgi:hypothetical protein